MRIAVAQIKCTAGDVPRNVTRITDRIKEAARAGCALVVVPEMSDTGYEMDVVHTCASSWQQGPLAEIRDACARDGTAAICGLSERDDDRLYNSAAIIDSSGHLVGKYRKSHLFSMIGEDRHVSPGDAFTVCKLGEFTVGLAICYDIRFPEMARALALAGADVLVTIAAWPVERIDHWRILNTARGIENQVYVLAANRVGRDGSLTFGGTSLVVDPYGLELARASESEPTLLTAEITRPRLEEVRTSMRVLNDRRPDLYHASKGQRAF